jgi:mono/diheme cytochrome c family protein
MSVADGREVFLKNCSGCHGINVDGRSPGGRALRPVAFDLADFQLTNAAVWRALEQGVPGSSMPAWRLLPNSELRAVMQYVQTVGRAGGLAQSDKFATDAALMEAGRRVFETHCARCHGEALDGNGPDAAQFLPRPANFHEILPSYEASAHIVREGVPGSGMPAWPLLTPAEIQAVTFYMRSFYAGPVAQQPATSAAEAEMQMGGSR